MGMPEVLELTIASGAPVRLDPREQRLLDVEPLDDRFDDPVAVGDRRRGPRRSRRCGRARACRREERIGLQRAGAFEPVARRRRACTSSSSAGTPALAKCAAICAPIVPAPSTADFANVLRVTSPEPADEQIHDRVGLRGERVLAPAENPVGRHLVERAEEHLRRQRRIDLACGTSPSACPSAITSRMMPRYSRR